MCLIHAFAVFPLHFIRNREMLIESNDMQLDGFRHEEVVKIICWRLNQAFK